MSVKVSILTVSDSGYAGTREDKSGDTAEALLQESGFTVVHRELVPDERALIANTLRRLCASGDVDCIITTGGTGVGPRDVTPEATLDVIERQLPGMAEAMRQEGLRKTPFAMLSRQVTGVAQATLIINLPGSPKAVEECLKVVLPVISHTVDLLHGKTRHAP